MYTLITEHAFVLGSTPEGEASRVLFLLTKSRGLIRVHAQGVRLERSKLRYLLSEGAWVRVTMVRGREVWRVVNACEGVGAVADNRLYVRAALRRVRTLARRLVHGEGDQTKLYAVLSDGCAALVASPDARTLRLLEVLLVARILNTQGYLSESNIRSGLLEGTSYEGIDMTDSDMRTLIRNVNDALRECQL